jgi:hypothetical protein
MIRYKHQLALNITDALPTASVYFTGGYLTIDLPNSPEVDLKAWLYGLLEGLPEIDAELETVHFIIKVKGSTELITLINPSEFDVTAERMAIESELSFSQPGGGIDRTPLPLDHPWYSDRGYFKRTTDKRSLFEKIKDLPNVKPTLDKLKAEGLL